MATIDGSPHPEEQDYQAHVESYGRFLRVLWMTAAFVVLALIFLAFWAG